MKVSDIAFVVVVVLSGLTVALTACAPHEQASLEPVERVNLSPSAAPGEGGLHGLWLDGCRDIADSGGEIVGVVRDALVLRRDKTFEVHTTYFGEGDCEEPEVSYVVRGGFRTGGIHMGGKGIDFAVNERGYMAHDQRGAEFLREDCPSAPSHDVGVLVPFQHCSGGGQSEAFVFHSAFRRVSVPGATEGMLLLGGLDFRPNFAGDASLRYPSPEDALKHVSSRDDIVPALYEP